MATQHETSDTLYLANAVRRACIRAAIEGYEHAAISGLCHESAWEAAISAIKMLDLEALLREGTTD
ncbi:MAG: acetyltransferase [Aestuariibacter sp.]|nr:acetyltransferase [Aestuariibacter sp.]